MPQPVSREAMLPGPGPRGTAAGKAKRRHGLRTPYRITIPSCHRADFESLARRAGDRQKPAPLADEPSKATYDYSGDFAPTSSNPRFPMSTRSLRV